ncbi:uncharacterized protein LOC117899640 isoform X1 [Drosophila subobscura]|uniref:uncharacterized protein LOC117899640 isoform X1 n=1 Tax=Drosophila subobscura TaxID=7241 RepID=UPI00155AA1FA|nr:uncharacterized protein LOC117899640 isoform X1 [Drosophila subobscura]
MARSPQAGSRGYILNGVISFFVAVTLGKGSLADMLQCYKCSVTIEKYVIENRTITTPLCSKFEENAGYMTHCPYSTMCLKTISILHLQNGQKQEAVTRGCAQQKNTTQIFRNKQWEQEHLVQEVYDEGCTEVKDNHLAGSAKINCYCRGELCNSSSLPSIDPNIMIIIVLLRTLWLMLSRST